MMLMMTLATMAKIASHRSSVVPHLSLPMVWKMATRAQSTARQMVRPICAPSQA